MTSNAPSKKEDHALRYTYLIEELAESIAQQEQKDAMEACWRCAGATNVAARHPHGKSGAADDPYDVVRCEVCIGGNGVTRQDHYDRLGSLRTTVAHMPVLEGDAAGAYPHAYAMVRTFADHQQSGMVFLLGPDGEAKTALALGAAKLLVGARKSVLWCDWPSLAGKVRDGTSSGRAVAMNALRTVQTADALVLHGFKRDDFTPDEHENLHRLMEYRFRCGACTVLTSALVPADLDPRERMMLWEYERVSVAYVGTPDLAPLFSTCDGRKLLCANCHCRPHATTCLQRKS